MPEFFSDENFPFPVIQKLRQLGHNVLTIQETGMAGTALSDEAVLAFAANTGRILLTMNRKHFIQLHKLNPHHSGIIVCSFDPNFDDQALRIHESVMSLESFSGHLIRVNRPAK